MLPDIQNFSELTGIDTRRKLTVNVRLRKHGNTQSNITFNGFVVYVDKFTFEIDLFDPIKFEIQLIDFDEGSGGIEVEHFSVNGLEILPKYQHLSSNGINYIDTYNKWVLEIPSPFYMWYHQISGGGWIA